MSDLLSTGLAVLLSVTLAAVCAGRDARGGRLHLGSPTITAWC